MGYTAANAAEFSDRMAERMAGAVMGISSTSPMYSGIMCSAEFRVEWCVCFVSWCAEQCGYLESGVIPKFSLCPDGVDWFNARGQFQDASYVPAAGDIIFFDWGNDGTIDHVGIVESVTNGVVKMLVFLVFFSCRVTV